MVEHDILSADTFGDVDHFRPYPMGFFGIAQMGGSMGEMDNEIPHGAFLRRDVVLRKFF